MDIFYALAEPRRRQIIEHIAHNGELSASDIGSKFNVTLPAISQHLKVNRIANLVKVEKHAQKRIYTINTETLQEVEDWISTMKKQWNARFDALEAVLEEEKSKIDSMNKVQNINNSKQKKYGKRTE